LMWHQSLPEGVAFKAYMGFSCGHTDAVGCVGVQHGCCAGLRSFELSRDALGCAEIFRQKQHEEGTTPEAWHHPYCVYVASLFLWLVCRACHMACVCMYAVVYPACSGGHAMGHAYFHHELLRLGGVSDYNMPAYCHCECYKWCSVRRGVVGG
jgi:hypothetical protein